MGHKKYENAFGHNGDHMGLKWDLIYSYRTIAKWSHDYVQGTV